MKKILLLAATLLITVSVSAQEFVRTQPAGIDRNVFAAASKGLASETRAAARDLAAFRDPKWTLLTIAQIAAASADVKTSLNVFQRCPTCVEVGISRLVVGIHPEMHKYAVAGLVEIGIEAVAAHYLRSHGPRKWYWRCVSMLPQTFSLYGHTRGSFHNAGLKLRCDHTGLICF
jgi:hypothetical protein